MTEIQKIPCPHCGDVLYQLGLLDDHGVWGKLPNAPSLENDKGGYFMSCPYCSRRVDMEVTSSPIGAGFRPRNS
jgi:DNA-directed RNA polymerase subunit RPC12/RpoP